MCLFHVVKENSIKKKRHKAKKLDRLVPKTDLSISKNSDKTVDSMICVIVLNIMFKSLYILHVSE